MIKIRSTASSDFSQVLGLLRQLWPSRALDSTRLPQSFEEALASTSQVYLCAQDGEEVIAFGSLSVKVSLWQAGHLGHVDELVALSAVHCSFQGLFQRSVATKGRQALKRLVGRRSTRTEGFANDDRRLT